MEEHVVRILKTEQITHDVKMFRVEKPEGYLFVPGQATDVSINAADLKDKKRPFTFTSLNMDPYLEFIIKNYPSHNGITSKLHTLASGDELIVRDVWGAIAYKGKGVFIAGGAGITPFISIFRDLHARNEISGNMLLFANKTKADVILEGELKSMLGKSFINILSEEKTDGYFNGFISKDFLKANIDDFDQNFYVCGPPRMMDMVLKQLSELGVEKQSVTLEF
jgi:ferredoxin-NADP reductase